MARTLPTPQAKRKTLVYIIEYKTDALATANGSCLEEGLEKLREIGSAEIIDVTLVEETHANA